MRFPIYDIVLRLAGQLHSESLVLGVPAFAVPVLEALHGKGSIVRAEKRDEEWDVSDAEEEGVLEVLGAMYGSKAVQKAYPAGHLDPKHGAIRQIEELAADPAANVFKARPAEVPLYAPWPGRLVKKRAKE